MGNRGAQGERATGQRWALLAGGMAHDFNNALHALRARLELALRQQPPNATEIHLQAALLNLQDAQNAASQLLDLARGEYAPRTPVDLRALLQETVERVPTDPRVHVTVQAPDEPVITKVDPTGIRHLIHNLIRNALQAMPEGGALSLVLGTLGGGHPAHGLDTEIAATLSVSDSGVGVPAKDLARLFDPPFTTKAGGTGLGLAVSRHVAHQHGGTLTCDSTPAEGSTFELRLPLNE